MLDEAEGSPFPEFLYHAAPPDIAEKIEKEGVMPGKKAMWAKLSKKGVTYWACSPMGAALYVSMKGYKRGQIAVYKAPLSAFDTSRLRPDSNYVHRENPATFEYEGGIGPDKLERVDF